MSAPLAPLSLTRLHTESLMAQGDSDRDGDYLCWHWTSSHDTALSPQPGLLSSSRDYQPGPAQWPGRHPTLIIALLGFPELQIGQSLMKRWFKIGHWGSRTLELITHQDHGEKTIVWRMEDNGDNRYLPPREPGLTRQARLFIIISSLTKPSESSEW